MAAVSTAAPYKVISPEQAEKNTVTRAAQFFAEHRLTALLVGYDAEGIFTEHDIVRLVASAQANPKTTTIASAMTQNPVCVAWQCPRGPALSLMRSAKFRHLPALNEAGRVKNVLDVVTLGRALFTEQKSLSAVFHQKVKLMFSFAKSFQSKIAAVAAGTYSSSSSATTQEKEDTTKGSGWERLASDGQKLLVMRPCDTVEMAAQAMVSEGVSALLVEDPDNGSLVGIVTESDIVRRVVARGADSSSTQLCVVMTQHPTTVRVDSTDPADSPMSALSLMFDKRFRHLPMVVGEKQRPHGILDILRLCQGVFGRKLQEDNRFKENHGMPTKSEDPSEWIVRGIECFRSRVHAASRMDTIRSDGEILSLNNVKKGANSGDSTAVKPTQQATTAGVCEVMGSASSDIHGKDPENGDASKRLKIDHAERFRSYMGKARKKSIAAEKCAQCVDFESAIKQFGLALHFVSIAKKQLNLIGEQGTTDSKMDNTAFKNMNMAVIAASIDIRLRRVGAYRIDGNSHEALEDIEAVLKHFSEVSNDTAEQRNFAEKIRVDSPEKVCKMRVELLIELDQFDKAIEVSESSSTFKCSGGENLFSKQLDMLKETSNDLYREGALQEAVTGYTSAIRLLTAIDSYNTAKSSGQRIQTNTKMHILYANRAACYMRFSPQDVESAIQDCERCTSLQPSFVKGWIRLCSYTLVAGDRVKARELVQQGLHYHPKDAELAGILSSAKDATRPNLSIPDKENDNVNRVNKEVQSTAQAKSQSAEDKVAELRALMLGLK